MRDERLSTDEKLEFLATMELFSVLDPADLRKVAEAVDELHFSDGAAIIQQGDTGDSMYIVVDGSIRISFMGADGREATLNEIGPGELIGEMALIDNAPRSMNCWAQGRTRVFSMSAADFHRLLDTTGLAKALLRFLVGRLRQTIGFAEGVSIYNLEARLARLLLHLADRYGVKEGTSTLIQRRTPQEQLALRVNASRSKVNVQLRAWAKEGVIALDRGRIRILDRRGLGEIAHMDF